MKIIDVLNKIANGEEVPERIKYGSVIWTYEQGNYINKSLSPNYLDSASRYLLGEYRLNESVLNSEVEIIDYLNSKGE